MADIWGWALIASKFALYLGVLTANGAVLTAIIFQFRLNRSRTMLFATLGLCAALSQVSLQGAVLTGDASGMSDPDILALLWSTPVGTTLMARVIGLGLLILGLFWGRAGQGISVLGGCIAIWSFGWTGHISGFDEMLPRIVLVLHLFAVSFWIGILGPLKRMTNASHTWADAAELGHRFGRLAQVTVPLLIMFGVYLSYLLVGSFAVLFGTGYGRVLIFKLVCVAALLTLAAFNKLRFVPALGAGNAAAAGQFRRAIMLEWVAFAGIFAITAILTSTLSLPT